ncbi:MAG: sigma-70 family RNA polymerase sigma factor [Clostridia bacterium]|jgi:RNA polymerase sigma-70 factor (ECF subfamily)|nr:sigma-70 family RNA polymerase sigma factor [Clostridia bacterium]
MQTEEIKNMIEKYSGLVYKVAITRSGNIENAEDVFQEVFIKYSQKMPKFENEEHEKAWFIRVTINLTKNLHNQAWNRKTVPLEETIQFEEKEEENIFQIVSTLPQNYRTVVYLFYYEGYKIKEISKILKTREGTIKTWLSRARESLKEKIEGGFENE